MASTRHIEDQHSIALATWVAANEQRHPELQFLSHWPNGGMRDRQVDRNGVTYSPSGVRLKKMGTRKGPLDYWLFARRLGFAGMAFEMKAPGQKATQDQLKWSKHLAEQGWHVPGPFDDWTLAVREIERYLALPAS